MRISGKNTSINDLLLNTVYKSSLQLKKFNVIQTQESLQRTVTIVFRSQNEL